MTTNNNHDPQDDPTIALLPTAPVTPWYAAAFGRFVDWVEDRTDRELTGPQALGLTAVAAVLAVIAIAATVWLLAQLLHLVLWLWGGPAKLAQLPIVHIALDPITAWATQHGTGLPVPPSTLLITWGIGGLVLAIAGTAGARGARIAWPIYGAATAAAAWFGATEPHRPVAAGLIVLAWGLASILVLRRSGGRAGTHVTVLPAACTHGASQPHSARPNSEGANA